MENTRNLFHGIKVGNPTCDDHHSKRFDHEGVGES